MPHAQATARSTGAGAQLALGGSVQLILHSEAAFAAFARDLDGHQWSFLHLAG